MELPLLSCRHRRPASGAWDEYQCGHTAVRSHRGVISRDACAGCRFRQREHTAPPDLTPIRHRCDVVVTYCDGYLRWLPVCLDNILQQVGVDVVLHVISDACSEADGWVTDLYASLPNVRLYRNARRLGPYRSLNRVFERLETPFLAVADADDMYEPGRLLRALTKLEADAADLYGAALSNVLDSGDRNNTQLRNRLKSFPESCSGDRWATTPEGCLVNPTLVVRRSWFEAMNGFADWPHSADGEFTSRSRRAGARIVTDYVVAGRRRLHSASLTARPDSGMQSTERERYANLVRERIQSFKPGFDPRPFGSLDRHRASADETECLNPQRPEHVTAVMVTGGDPSRYRLARQAVEDFRRQTWANTSLLVVNHGWESVSDGQPGLREVFVRGEMTIGTLRNIGLDHAEGDWVAGWDDDDRHHPDRITEQMRWAVPGSAVCLRRQVRFDVRTQAAFVFETPRTRDISLEGTILHDRRTPHRYRDLRFGEDTHFIRQFSPVVIAENSPDLFVRRFHGTNICSERHVMQGHSGDSLPPDLSARLAVIYGKDLT